MIRRSPHCRPVPAIAAAVLCAGVSLAPAQTSPAPAPPATTQSAADNEAAETLAMRKEREGQLKNMPVVHVKSLREVVQFAIEKDDIVVRTTVPPTDICAVVVDGQPTLISVSAQRGDAPPAAQAQEQGSLYQPPFFSVMRHEYPPSGGVAITQINVVVPRVAISKSAEAAGEFRNVDFIQSDDFLEESDDRVRFYVQEHRNDEPVVDLKLSAKNVAELRRKYPAETMRYLEPIFREFGQSGVLFQVSPQAAWQVLGAAITPPADVVKQVEAILVELDADDAKQRDTAARELEQLGQPAALVLMQRDRSKLSEEQQARVETFLAPFKPLSDDEAERMRSDMEFLLTALSAEDPALAARALERLKEVAKQPIAFDVSATGAARAEAIAKLRAQLIPATTRPATTQLTPRSTPPPEAEEPSAPQPATPRPAP
ncbi:MAG TPA: hypothetical protein VGR35_11845 [Tepidisphaeraceae bacterium]|nr:hypothetical protein [Tepidisphaeraceae bacterium]